METIIYQGQSIDVERVSRISGDFTVWSRGEFQSWHSGDEDLYRDAHGQYYLARSLRFLDYDSELERKASGRKYLHRISLKAAALWAVMRPFSDSDSLKRDLNAALAAPKTSGTRHFEDGSMAVTLHLKPEPARLLRDACRGGEQSPVQFAYEALASHASCELRAGSLEIDDAIEAGFANHAPDDESDERTVVNLLHADGSLYARVPLEPDLEAKLDEMARKDGSDIGTALVNCLRRFHAQQQAEIVGATEPETITVPLTLPVDLYRRILAMGEYDERADLSETIVHSMVGDLESWLEAPDTDPSPTEFLEQFLEEHPLPTLLQQPTAYGVSQATLEAAARYAATAGRTVDEMIAELLEGVATENPEATGASQASPGFADLDDHAQELLRKHVAENPEDDPRDVLNGYLVCMLESVLHDKGFTSRECLEGASERRLALEAKGEQRPRPEIRHAVNLCAALAFVRARIDAIDPDGDGEGEQDATPLRYVHIVLYATLKRFGQVFGFKVSEMLHLPPDQTKPLVKARATVELDERALALVQRYAGRWEKNVVDVVNGALHFALKDEGEQVPGCIELLDFMDAITARRLGLDNWLTQPTATPASHGRHKKTNPADVALLAAGALEAVDPVEEDADLPVEEHVDEPRPIRAVLADLAADWRAKAKEARTQAQDLQPFSASHKMHGQADLLEQCADTLAQAIAGAKGEEGR